MSRLYRSLGFIPDAFVNDNECPREYLNKPHNDNDERTVTRLADNHTLPYINFSSTSINKIKVRLPRVTFIDGPYMPAQVAA